MIRNSLEGAGPGFWVRPRKPRHRDHRVAAVALSARGQAGRPKNLSGDRVGGLKLMALIEPSQRTSSRTYSRPSAAESDQLPLVSILSRRCLLTGHAVVSIAHILGSRENFLAFREVDILLCFFGSLLRVAQRWRPS